MSDHKCVGYGCAVCELKEVKMEDDDLRARLAAAEARAEKNGSDWEKAQIERAAERAGAEKAEADAARWERNFDSLLKAQGDLAELKVAAEARAERAEAERDHQTDECSFHRFDALIAVRGLLDAFTGGPTVNITAAQAEAVDRARDYVDEFGHIESVVTKERNAAVVARDRAEARVREVEQGPRVDRIVEDQDGRPWLVVVLSGHQQILLPIPDDASGLALRAALASASPAPAACACGDRVVARIDPTRCGRCGKPWRASPAPSAEPERCLCAFAAGMSADDSARPGPHHDQRCARFAPSERGNGRVSRG